MNVMTEKHIPGVAEDALASVDELGGDLAAQVRGCAT